MPFSLLLADAGLTLVRMDDYGKKLRRMRDEQGWTQDELGQKSGLSRAQIQKMERGETVTRRSWAKAAAAFGLAVDDIAPPFTPDADSAPWADLLAAVRAELVRIQPADLAEALEQIDQLRDDVAARASKGSNSRGRVLKAAAKRKPV